MNALRPRRAVGLVLGLAGACGSGPPRDLDSPRPQSVSEAARPPAARPAPPAPVAPIGVQRDVSSSAPHSAPASGPAGDRVVLRVNGKEFRAGEIFDPLLFHFRDVAMELLRKRAGDEIVRAEAERLGVAVDPNEVEEGVRASLEQLRARVQTEYGPSMDLARFFEVELGTSREEHEASLRAFVSAGRLAALLIRYDELRNERASVRDIVVRERAKADEIVEKLRDGADFAALARAESVGPSKSEGGKIAPFDRDADSPDVPREVAEAAFEAAPGALIGPIEATRGGETKWHVVKVLERIPGREVAFEKVRDEIKKGLAAKPIEVLEYEAYMRKMAKRYPVEMLGRAASAPAR